MDDIIFARGVRVRNPSGGGSQLPTESVSQIGSATTVAGNSQITLLTYTVAVKDLWLDSIIATGDVDAEFVLFINTVKKLVYRTSEQDRTMKLLYPVAQLMTVGTIIDVKVTHWNVNTANFDATLTGHKY